MSTDLYMDLLEKLEIEKEFINKAIYLPLQKSVKRWNTFEQRRKEWIDERLKEVYQHESEYRQKIYKKLYKSYDGYPCEHCDGTRLFYDPTLNPQVKLTKETYRKKMTYTERQMGYVVCSVCYTDMEVLTDLKMITEGIVDPSKLWVYPRNKEKFGNIGTIYELLSSDNHNTEENKLLHETFYDLVGGTDFSKLEQLNWSTKPKNRKANKTKLDKFLYLFNYKYQTSINLNLNYQEQRDYFDLFINNKISTPNQLNYNSPVIAKARKFGASFNSTGGSKVAAEFENK